MRGEVIVLGSGTSNGVPMLGIRYPESFLANPKNHRSRSSILVRGSEGNLLVDCAPELRLQLLREEVHMVDAVIITHTHADHIMGMDDLRSFTMLAKKTMPIYTLPRYQDDLRRVFDYAFAPLQADIVVPQFDLRDAPPTLNTCGLEVHIFQVMHGPWPVLGLRIADFAYLTDVNVIPEAVWPILEGLDTLVLDGVRRKPHPTHFHFERSIEVAKEIGARQTYFTHLSHDYDHDVTNAELPPEIQLAYDGLRIPL
jgi:phosphoribosyl 1,2-cyclic phosphate phosphodiesterase